VEEGNRAIELWRDRRLARSPEVNRSQPPALLRMCVVLRGKAMGGNRTGEDHSDDDTGYQLHVAPWVTPNGSPERVGNADAHSTAV